MDRMRTRSSGEHERVTASTPSDEPANTWRSSRSYALPVPMAEERRQWFLMMSEDCKFRDGLQIPLPHRRSVARIGVRSADFTWVHQVLILLRNLGHRPCHLEADEAAPHDVQVVLSTVEESVSGELGLRRDHLESDLAKALRNTGTTTGKRRVVIGVDPGPRPGVVWSVDGREEGAKQLNRPEDVARVVQELSDAHEHRPMVVRVGDGDPGVRNRILRDLFDTGHAVELVDERRTSKGLARHDHIGAARRIHRLRGRAMGLVPDDPRWEGMVRDVQRQSREWTEGRLTLPSGLALDVARGELSMAEAVAKMEGIS